MIVFVEVIIWNLIGKSCAAFLICMAGEWSVLPFTLPASVISLILLPQLLSGAVKERIIQGVFHFSLK